MKISATGLRRLVALIAFPAVMLGIIIPVVIYREAIWFILSTPEALGGFLEERGAVVQIAYIGFHVVRAWIFFIPTDVPQVAGGFLFGWSWGFLYTLIGLAIGNYTVFVTSRFLGVPFVRAVVGDNRFERVYALAVGAKAQVGFLFLFLIPGFPKNVLCFIGGVTPIKAGTFMLVSLVARSPGILGSSIIGNAVANGQFTVVLVVYGVGAFLAALGLLHRKRLEKWIFQLSGLPVPPTAAIGVMPSVEPVSPRPAHDSE